jgi:polysaccharide pyruvyl transferase WcaK-like protein
VKVGFWGNFGTHNLGNECTLNAMLDGARRHLTDAELVGVCSDPTDTEPRHHVSADRARAAAFVPAATRPSPPRASPGLGARRLAARAARDA